MSIEELADNAPFSEDTHVPTIIKVVGVGGGGNNAINHMYQHGVENVSFAVINTDRQALITSPVPTKVLIGPTTTKGLGAGNIPQVAREAAEESATDIDALFDDDTRMVFITAGMGGGTGTGAAPVVARIAKERGLLTIGIVTIPFLFEGEKKILKALDGADEMSKYVDALLVINNERLTEIYKDLDFLNGFGKADDTLCTAASSISEIITKPGKINCDFNDVETTLRNGGTAIISSGIGEGENRVTDAINNALHSPLLKNRDIFGSRRLLFNIYFDPTNTNNTFKMEEANQLTNFISQLDREVDVIWGAAFDETLGDKVKITILAAGFNATVRQESEELMGATKPEHKVAKPVITPAPKVEEKKEEKVEEPKSEIDTQNAHQRLSDLYGASKLDAMQQTNARSRYRVFNPGEEDDSDVIEGFNTPALNRPKQISNPVTPQQRPTTPPASHNSRAIEF